MKWSSQQYALAKQLGLTLWFERTALWMIKPARIFATLGVIVSQPLATEAEHKLFEGLLNVVSLKTASDYWVGWFDGEELGENLTPAYLVWEWEKWRPYAILGLGPSLRKLSEQQQDLPFQQVHFIATYHPRELIENASLKRKTYQDLLNLKDTISLIQSE